MKNQQMKNQREFLAGDTVFCIKNYTPVITGDDIAAQLQRSREFCPQAGDLLKISQVYTEPETGEIWLNFKGFSNIIERWFFAGNFEPKINLEEFSTGARINRAPFGVFEFANVIARNNGGRFAYVSGLESSGKTAAQLIEKAYSILYPNETSNAISD